MQLTTSQIASIATDTLPEDDIDQLFEKLEKVEPPTNITQQILARIKQLPASQRYPQAAQSAVETQKASRTLVDLSGVCS